MELIHCRGESCWLQNPGPPQREGTLPAANPAEILREARTMESETSTEEPPQPQWHVSMGQELGQQPARAASPCWDSPRLRAPLHCPHCPTVAVTAPAVPHQVWQTLQPTLHCQQGTAATPTLLHCLLQARSSKSWQLRALSSAFQEKAWFSSHQKHLTAHLSLFEGSLTERQHPSTKAHSYSQLPSSGAPNWLGKAEVQALAKMRGKKNTPVLQKIQMGHEAQMKTGGLCPQSTTPALQLTMHMPRSEQLRSFLTWKTKWWRACKCFLQLHEHKWGTYKKSLSSSLQNPFCSVLSQREHQFSVWRATAKPASESHLPAETDWPLPPFLSSQPRLRALSSARQGSVPTFSAGLQVQTCRMCPCSGEGNSQLLSLRNNECKRFRLKKATDTEMSAPFSLKATQCQLSPCSGCCLSCNMGTLHYTAQQWQHRPLEQRKGFQDLILPMLFWWSQGHQLHLSAEDLTVPPCLCSRDMPKKRWPCKEQALCVILQTCMVTYKPIMRYAHTNSTLC